MNEVSTRTDDFLEADSLKWGWSEITWEDEIHKIVDINDIDDDIDYIDDIIS